MRPTIFFLALTIALAGGQNVNAQTTSVTGKVSDATGLAYAGAQLKAQLVLAGGAATGQATVTISNAAQCASAGAGSAPCQVPFIGTIGPITLDSGGNIPGGLAIQDNALITPAATQWLITVSETPGIPPPLGSGPQTCSATLTITGASQSITASFSSCPALSNTSPGVSLSPGGSNQTITPKDTSSVPLTITGAAGTTVDLLDVNVNGPTKVFGLNNTGSTLTLGNVGFTISCAPGGATCILTAANNNPLQLQNGGSGPVNIRTTGNLGLGVGVASPGFHITFNAANGDTAGKLTCAASTATKTFSTAYTSTPTVLVFDETTKGGVNLTAISNTGFTASCTGATDALDYFVFGNPN